MEAGDTFRLRYGSHLWVVVSDPKLAPDHVLLVNMTTARGGHDPACVLKAGDHPFVKHATCMNYAASRIASDSDMERMLSGGQIILEPPVSGAALKRIRQGAAKSDFIAIDRLELLKKQGLVEP